MELHIFAILISFLGALQLANAAPPGQVAISAMDLDAQGISCDATYQFWKVAGCHGKAALQSTIVIGLTTDPKTCTTLQPLGPAMGFASFAMVNRIGTCNDPFAALVVYAGPTCEPSIIKGGKHSIFTGGCISISPGTFSSARILF
jgi:hypothetical protein